MTSFEHEFPKQLSAKRQDSQKLIRDSGVKINDPDKGSMVPELVDSELLALASQGDKEAFGELYLRYVNRIYSYVYYRTGNTHDAEDLTARVFYRAMRHITNYKDQGVPFSAWLYRIAHNLVANWHRDNSRRQEIPLDDGYHLFIEKSLPENVLLKTEEVDLLLQVLRRLPDDRQQLLILKYVDRLSNAEIGQVMGRTEGAIKSLYHRTLIGLREDLYEMNRNSIFPWDKGV